VRVYISSSYKDLRDHRAAVDLALRRMGHEVVGMEQYVAEGMTPVDRSLSDVRGSDAYLVIVAWRYGYVPTVANPSQRSITELEYEAALGAGIPILVFLLDPEAAWSPAASDVFSDAGGSDVIVSARAWGPTIWRASSRRPTTWPARPQPPSPRSA
jgi:hypothetical protein